MEILFYDNENGVSLVCRQMNGDIEYMYEVSILTKFNKGF